MIVSCINCKNIQLLRALTNFILYLKTFQINLISILPMNNKLAKCTTSYRYAPWLWSSGDFFFSMKQVLVRWHFHVICLKLCAWEFSLHMKFWPSLESGKKRRHCNTFICQMDVWMMAPARSAHNCYDHFRATTNCLAYK